MTVVQEAIQLESEQHLEQYIPEAQLLEKPVDLINGMQQIATETGLIPNFDEAIGIAHTSDNSFKIDIKTNIDSMKENQFNDGKAAIAAAICGVTRTCADKCCSIGEKALENAGNNPIAVRLELVRTLQKENPDFFNQPNADKLITEQVKEIMASKKTEIPATPTPKTDIKTVNAQSGNTLEIKSEQKKPKTELPWNKKLTPEEEKQRMEALTGTYAKRTKIESIETPETTSRTDSQQSENTTTPISKVVETNVVEKTIEQKTIEMQPITQPSPIEVPQPKPKQIIPDKPNQTIQNRRPKELANSILKNIQAPQKETVSITSPLVEKPAPIKPVEVANIAPPFQEKPQVIKPNQVSPIVPPERVTRHRPKIETSTSNSTSKQTEINSVQPEKHNNQTVIEKSQIPPLFQPDMPIQQIDNVQPTPTQSGPKPKENPLIEVAEQIISIPTVQITESVNTVMAPVVQPIIEKLPIETIQVQAPVIEQTVQFPSAEKSMFHSKTDAISSLETPITLSEKTIQTTQISLESQHTNTPVEAVISNETPIIIQEHTVASIQIEPTLPDQPINVNIATGNEITPSSTQIEQTQTADIQNKKLQPQKNTTHETLFIDSDETVTLFTFEDADKNEDSVKKELEANFISAEVIITDTEPHSTEKQTVETVEHIELQEIVIEKPLEQIEEIRQPITQDSLMQLLTSLISENPSEPLPMVTLDGIENDVSNSDQNEEPVSFDTETFPGEIPSLERNTEQITVVEQKQPIPFPELITVTTTAQELPKQITEILQHTPEEPTIVFVLPNIPEPIIENHTEILKFTETSHSDKDTEETQTVIKEKQETFFIQMLNQEQTLNFFYLIQDITDILAFIHNQNKEEILADDSNVININEVAPEELKNDTFGKYDDTVVQTIWPIIQFMLFIQNIEICIPRLKQLPQRHPELVSGSFNVNLQ